MLRLNFLYAASLLILGVFGLMNVKNPEDVRALGLPGLFFGGAVLFCSFFALKEPRHGLAGASFLAFLAFLTAGSIVLGSVTRGALDLGSPAHQVALGILVLSLLYLIPAITTWRRARKARLLAELLGDEGASGE